MSWTWIALVTFPLRSLLSIASSRIPSTSNGQHVSTPAGILIFAAMIAVAIAVFVFAIRYFRRFMRGKDQ